MRGPRGPELDFGLGRGALPRFQRLNNHRVTHDLARLLTPSTGGGWNPRLHGFETPAQAVQEDKRGARNLTYRALRHGPADCARLALKLNESELNFAHNSLASARYQLAKRRVECDGFITRINKGPKVRAITLVNPAWNIPAGALRTTKTDHILEALHHALTKVPAPPGEWFFCQIHGEFDGTTNTIQLHVHCLATAEYEERLRAYAKGKSGAKVKYPIKGQEIEDAARQVSYVVQRIWFNRPSYIDQVGKTKRGTRSRIPEPWGSDVLLWLDRQTLTTMQLRLGLGNGWYPDLGR